MKVLLAVSHTGVNVKVQRSRCTSAFWPWNHPTKLIYGACVCWCFGCLWKKHGMLKMITSTLQSQWKFPIKMWMLWKCSCCTFESTSFFLSPRATTGSCLMHHLLTFFLSSLLDISPSFRCQQNRKMSQNLKQHIVFLWDLLLLWSASLGIEYAKCLKLDILVLMYGLFYCLCFVAEYNASIYLRDGDNERGTGGPTATSVSNQPDV